MRISRRRSVASRPNDGRVSGQAGSTPRGLRAGGRQVDAQSAELSELTPTRYHKISHNPIAIRTPLVDLFLEAHARPPRQIILDLDATDDPLHGEQEGRFFHGYYDCYCYLPLYVFCGRHLLVAKLGVPTWTRRPARSRR